MIVTVNSRPKRDVIAKLRNLLNEIVQYENLNEYLKIPIVVPDIENCMEIVVCLH